MNIIFTCGGTAGHINPAIALAGLFQREVPDCNILFIGGKGGMEETLVPREGFEIRCARVSNIWRGFSLKCILHNIDTLWCTLTAMVKVRRIFREFRPDAVIGMGGYASYPAMRQAAAMGIPVFVHEANAMPGLTTRMIADRADRIFVSYEESRAYYHHPERVEVVGMPVRREFFADNGRQLKEKLGYGDKKLVVSCWGSLGARDMNRAMIAFMKQAAEEKPGFVHIHATGKEAWAWMPQELEQAGVKLTDNPELELRQYIYNMPELMTAADLFISRAGASSLGEITAGGTPSVIVPSPNVTANHQEKNARVLAEKGAAVVIREADCSGELLYQTVKELLADEQRLATMSSAAKQLAVADSSERIFRTIMSTLSRKAHE